MGIIFLWQQEVFDAIIGLVQNAKLLSNDDYCIIDLENGHQPFEKDSYEIVFNGEIYNYKNIKENLELKGYDFK